MILYLEMQQRPKNKHCSYSINLIVIATISEKDAVVLYAIEGVCGVAPCRWLHIEVM